MIHATRGIRFRNVEIQNTVLGGRFWLEYVAVCASKQANRRCRKECRLKRARVTWRAAHNVGVHLSIHFFEMRVEFEVHCRMCVWCQIVSWTQGSWARQLDERQLDTTQDTTQLNARQLDAMQLDARQLDARQLDATQLDATH
jgi:hypothetical protein